MDTEPKKYHIITYGCQMNEADSARFATQLRQISYTYTPRMDLADLILINTCCVRESAEKKIFGKIGELKRLKRQNPNLKIVIAGCLAQKDREKLIQKFPHVDVVLGTFNSGHLIEYLEQADQEHKRIVAVHERTNDIQELARQGITSAGTDNSAISAFVPIMYGCNNFCTYCIVPYVRGRERSRQPQEILKEIRQLAANGIKEVTLLGQNVNSYGKDLTEPMDFADLLMQVDALEHIGRIRFITSHPRDMNDKLIAAVQHGSKICEHFHLPVQSGSDLVLKAMNRGYTTASYRLLVEKLRTVMPQASITTDIIVGFPGETEALFQQTLEFMRAVQFDAAFTFLYSKRSGTPAAEMSDQVPLAEKKERLQRLADIQNEISLSLNRKMEGSTVQVLIEGPSKNNPQTLTGRTRTNKIVLWDKSGCEQVGQLANVQIEHAQTFLLKGRLLCQ